MGRDRGRVADPYGELIELAERERRLIEARDHEGLAALVAEREALMAELPAKAPADAHDAIRRLIELQLRNDAAMGDAARGLEVELQRLHTGRSQVRRYAPAAPTSHRLDRTA